jgi:enamine deaminase RidA (YjgF/YER057c/UK114 family)
MITLADSANKTVAYMGVPWEDAYGYAQVVRAGNTLYVSGQLSHDDQGQACWTGPCRCIGKITDTANMELQMRTAYANAAKLLAKFGAALR